MKNTQGFSLVECTLYCMLLALLSFLVVQFFNKSSVQLLTLDKQGQQLALLYSCTDLLARDIQSADPESSHWHFAYQEFVFKTEQGCIGWVIKDHALYRITGTYNFGAHAWHKKTKALLIQQVNEFQLIPLEVAQQIENIELNIAIAGVKRAQHISLINRVLA